MIGIDTNVLVRYLTRDDPDQYAAAKSFLEATCTEERPGFVSTVVLCELVWVLRSAYDVDRDDIARVVDQILRTKQLRVDARDAVRDAVVAFRESDAGFADCLIGMIGQRAGCKETVTFDRKAASMNGWRNLKQ